MTSVHQDEPRTGNGQGAGNTASDASLSPLAVRSERNGNKKTPGDGRVYHIAFTATDTAGAECTGVVNVCVPGFCTDMSAIPEPAPNSHM